MNNNCSVHVCMVNFEINFRNSHDFLFQSSNVENLSPQIIRHIAKEVADLTKDPPEGIKVIPNEEDITDIQATIEGPGNNTDIHNREMHECVLFIGENL